MRRGWGPGGAAPSSSRASSADAVDRCLALRGELRRQWCETEGVGGVLAGRQGVVEVGLDETALVRARVLRADDRVGHGGDRIALRHLREVELAGEVITGAGHG